MWVTVGEERRNFFVVLLDPWQCARLPQLVISLKLLEEEILVSWCLIAKIAKLSGSQKFPAIRYQMHYPICMACMGAAVIFDVRSVYSLNPGELPGRFSYKRPGYKATALSCVGVVPSSLASVLCGTMFGQWFSWW